VKPNSPLETIDSTAISQLLDPFGIRLDSNQLGHLQTYLELLLRWNQRMNLTAVRIWEECVTRHFGESLFASRFVEIRGRLLDIGSGAGFPGLALKLVSPDLCVTLLEPVAKKRAFLKEIARACGFEHVDVRPDRLCDYVQRARETAAFDIATARAVAKPAGLIGDATTCLKARGLLCLWTTRGEAETLRHASSVVKWREPVPIPLSRDRELWVGERST
jgi:16S rRNA (guanine527-N7)-methyltransferase